MSSPSSDAPFHKKLKREQSKLRAVIVPYNGKVWRSSVGDSRPGSEGNPVREMENNEAKEKDKAKEMQQKAMYFQFALMQQQSIQYQSEFLTAYAMFQHMLRVKASSIPLSQEEQTERLQGALKTPNTNKFHGCGQSQVFRFQAEGKPESNHNIDKAYLRKAERFRKIFFRIGSTEQNGHGRENRNVG